MKPVVFVGNVRRDIGLLPERVRRRAGHELYLLQVGREPADRKLLLGVGAGAYELRLRDKAGAFRVVYAAKRDVIYVLHAFQKKTRKTSTLDVRLAAARYKQIEMEP